MEVEYTKAQSVMKPINPKVLLIIVILDVQITDWLSSCQNMVYLLTYIKEMSVKIQQELNESNDLINNDATAQRVFN